MEMSTYVDKSAWGDGPWQIEPDHAVWTDDATGYICEITRRPAASLCGYVYLPAGHILYGVDHRAIGAAQVHNGLTYSRHAIDTTTGLTLWCLGFDTGSVHDINPDPAGQLRKSDAALMHDTVVVADVLSNRGNITPAYRTFDYVVSELARLCRQLRDLGALTHA